MTRALITGITGQDGVLLAGNLLDRGYEVIGFGRRPSIRVSYTHLTLPTIYSV